MAYRSDISARDTRLARHLLAAVVLLAASGAGVAMKRNDGSVRERETIVCPEPAAIPLNATTLEPRFLSPIGFESIAELDEALGGPVPAWEPFTYARDASGRLAIASEPYRLGGREPEATFVTDGHGGLWRLPPAEPFVSTGNGAWTRRVWLVPLGSGFRGTYDNSTD